MNGGQQPDGVVFFARMFFNGQNFAFVKDSDASTAICRVYHDEPHRIQYRRTGGGGRRHWPLDGPKASSTTTFPSTAGPYQRNTCPNLLTANCIFPSPATHLP